MTKFIEFNFITVFLIQRTQVIRRHSSEEFSEFSALRTVMYPFLVMVRLDTTECMHNVLYNMPKSFSLNNWSVSVNLAVQNN